MTVLEVPCTIPEVIIAPEICVVYAQPPKAATRTNIVKKPAKIHTFAEKDLNFELAILIYLFMVFYEFFEDLIFRAEPKHFSVIDDE